MLIQSQDLAALLGMAQDQTEDRTIRRVGDREPDDLDPGSLKGTVDLEQLPYSVLEKNRELSHGRPASTMERLEFNLAAAVILSKTHEGPRGARSSVAGKMRSP